ncbi:calpastatin isoform X5 [Brachyhypopomus gauderio]|uniref:calpastatin isoform X5 n=1 Tax=Brachyhypopomus gauderio TaxID=698409 RepID=UPI0040426F4A
MPTKKKNQRHRKKSKLQHEESAKGESPFQSDLKPKPTSVPVSTVKATEHEKGAAPSSSPGTAAKPGTPAAGASAPPPAAAAGTVPVATVGAGLSGAPKVSAGASQGPPATGGRPTGAAGSTGTQSGGPKVTSQVSPATPAKAPQASAGSGTAGGAGGGAGGVGGTEKHSTSPVKPKDTSKDKAQSTAVPLAKLEPSKVSSAGVVKPSASAGVSVSPAHKDGGQSKDAKVHAEGPALTTKASAPVAAADPFDALAESLPSSDPQGPTGPQFTGPEVKERDVTSEVANRCGDRESTLPPGYRREDMEKKIPAGAPEKPEKQPKPMTTDEALETLSTGFLSSEVSSTGKPGVKQEVSGPASKSPAAPADKKTKVETASPSQSVKPKTDKVHVEEQTLGAKTSAPEKKSPVAAALPVKPKEQPKPSLDEAVKSHSAGFVSSSAPKLETNRAGAPPADKKAKIEKFLQETATAAQHSLQAVRSKTDAVGPMSVDAVDALGDLLPDSKPAPEAPAPKPGDIVDEKKLNPEEGVRVGEREDSIPPEYRFSKEDLQKYPAPPKQPSLDPDEALDLLSEDFSCSAAAPVAHASVPPSAPPKQADPMSADALSALEDMLPVSPPTPESPKLRPEDFIDEKELTAEKGVRVGERDDTLPPGYRFPKGDVSKEPAPPPREPSMDTDDALDILSGDFDTPAGGSTCHVSQPPSAPPADSSADFALEELAGDFIAPAAASKIHSAAPAPPKADRQLSESTSSAMDALGDTLMDISSTPEPTPVSPKDIVKEKEAVEEHVSKPGERDDSLPPDYRPTEADIKAAAEAKAKAKAEDSTKKKSLDEAAALDLLSSDFSTPAAPATSPVCPPHGPAAKTPPTKTAPGPVPHSTATGGLPETKPKDVKPKKVAGANVSASEDVSSKMSTDVVSTSSLKKGGKS